MIEEVQGICYLALGDAVGSSEDVQSSVTATCRIRAGWRKFSKFSQVLCGRAVLSLKLKGRLYKSCIRSVIDLNVGR